MKVKLLFIALFSMVIQAQTVGTKVLFEDSFESYEDFSIEDIGDWITLDLDGSSTVGLGAVWENRLDPQAFIVFNPISLGISSSKLSPKTGDKFIGAFAALLPEEGGRGPNNDWLISPPIQLGASANEVRFWVKSLGETPGVEAYEVGVYTGTGKKIDPADFTIISEERALTVPFLDWEQRSYNLDAYANQTVRIGIHFKAEDMHLFMIDDFKVTTGVLGTTDFFADHFSVFPNPANDVLNIVAKNGREIKVIRIIDWNGKIVKTVSVPRQTETQINTADLAAGAYVIAIQTNEGNTIFKFLKN